MENVRICILNSLDSPVGFMDNKTPNALHYWDDKLHTYLKGSASTFEFSCDVTHPDATKLVVGGRVAFVYKGRQYYFTIMSTDQTETDLTVTCYATALGLINTYVNELSEPGLQTIQWYVNKFDEFGFIEIGTNEIMSKQLNLQFNSDATLLSRLFELADEFEAEIDFTPILNNDYSLKKIELNIYRKYDEETGGNGIGTRRTDKVIRYNRDIDGITKVTDISELFTAIKAYGNDDAVNLFKMTERVIYDEDGNIKFRKPAQDYYIYAVQAKDQFPSSILAQGTERYISMRWTYSTSDSERLYEKALAELRKKSIPKLEYTISGYFDCEIGDIFRIQDEEFNPPLYVEARVSEIEVSFTDPSQNSVVIDNFKELKSQISSDILARITEMTSVATEKAEEAIEIAGSVSEIAQGAKDTADEANVTAGNAQSTANQAQTSANNAQSTADTALIKTSRMRFYEDKGLFISSEILDNVDDPENTPSVQLTDEGLIIHGIDSKHFEEIVRAVAKFSGNEIILGNNEEDSYVIEEEGKAPQTVHGIPKHLVIDSENGLRIVGADYVDESIPLWERSYMTVGPDGLQSDDSLLISSDSGKTIMISGGLITLFSPGINITARADYINFKDETGKGTTLQQYVESHGGGTGAETDPVFTASPAHGITANDISKWNNKGDVKTVNGIAPDDDGNVEVPSSSNEWTLIKSNTAQETIANLDTYKEFLLQCVISQNNGYRVLASITLTADDLFSYTSDHGDGAHQARYSATNSFSAGISYLGNNTVKLYHTGTSAHARLYGR